MGARQPTVTYLELRESAPDGSAAAGLSHTGKGLVLLHVQELAAAGEPRGAVTFVHDAGGHGGLYLGLAERLAEAGWSVALPDLRGHGRSEGPRGHANGIAEIVRDLGDVQDHLAYRQPEAPKVLVGLGLGALWCLAYACERPGTLAGLALAAPLVEPRFELPAAPGGLRGLFAKPGPRDEGRTGWPPAARAGEPAVQAALAAPPAHERVTRGAAAAASDAARRYLPRAADLALPVLALVGMEDPLAPAAEMRALLVPPIELAEVPRARHELFHGATGTAAAERLLAWLARIR